MNRLSITDRTRVIACLVEGNSQRATVRITGIAKKTVARLAVGLFNCHDCGCPLLDPSAKFPWTAGFGKIVDVCSSCNEKRLRKKR